MVASTRRNPRLPVAPVRPLCPANSSGVKKLSRRTPSSKTRPPTIIKLRCHSTNDRSRRTSLEDLTTMMANTSISEATTGHRLTENRERPQSGEDTTTLMAGTTISPSPTENKPPTMLEPPATLVSPTNLIPSSNILPPTKLESPPAAAPEPSRQGRIALNCRYRVPNTYLTVYHRRGRVMLCRPWEEPWLNSGNKGCGWL